MGSMSTEEASENPVELATMIGEPLWMVAPQSSCGTKSPDGRLCAGGARLALLSCRFRQVAQGATREASAARAQSQARIER